jgi:hypothetical protein
MSPTDPDEEKKHGGAGPPKPPPAAPPVFNRPGQPPQQGQRERPSLLASFFKAIGVLILVIVILIGLALGTCFLLVASHR